MRFKNKLIGICVFLLCLGIFVPKVSAARTSPLVIDHTAVAKFANLTDSQILTASRLRMLFHHASVGSTIGEPLGSNYIDGLSGLEMVRSQYGTKFNRNAWEFVARGNPSWTSKISMFNSLVASELNNFDVFAMKFCYIDYMAGWSEYRSAMEQLEARNPSKTFIWVTIPIKTLTSSSPQSNISEQIQRHTFNTNLRQYAVQNNKVLYDLADIESFKYNTNTPALITLGGNTLPYYPMYSPDPRYTNDGGHPIDEGRLILGKAFWVLMAGLSGPLPSTNPTPTGTGNPADANSDGKVDGVDYVVWLNHYGQSVTGKTVGDFNNNGRVDGVDYVVWLNNYGR